ncbi:MAG: hypothetical protein RR726_13215 [Pseudomonas sp.]
MSKGNLVYFVFLVAALPPLTLSGQLIVFETLFALLYAFLWRQTGPSVLEAAAIVLVMGGVLWSMRQHRTPRALAKPVHT